MTAGYHRTVTPGTPLTEREAEILPMLAEGLSNQQIATRLFLAEDTIKTHIARMLLRLAATNRTHAVSIAYQRGLLRMPARRAPDAAYLRHLAADLVARADSMDAAS